MEQTFKVDCNGNQYGKCEADIVTLKEFIEDAESWELEQGNQLGVFKHDEYTVENLKKMKIGQTITTYSPHGWDTKVTRIK